MAVSSDSTRAPAAHPFNPTDWLAQFEARGGAYSATDHALHLAILVPDRTDAELICARLMVRRLSPANKAAIFAHLRGKPAAFEQAEA